jgi:dipeptidyl-peptidase-4
MSDETRVAGSPRALHESLSFPRLSARTLQFSLGVPRNLSVTPDGSRVLFIRTPSGTSRTGALWVYEVVGGRSGQERCIADPDPLLSGVEELSAEELSRRERSREAGAGIVAYTVDAAGSVAVFALSGRLWVADVGSGEVRELPATGYVLDPHVDPTGRWSAYASDGALRVVGLDGNDARALVEPDGDNVVWGRAEFVAAEEMDRDRGYWWSPDGQRLLVERYDESPVSVWYVADPAEPARQPYAHRYPAAGTANADVSLWLVGLDGRTTQVTWDRDVFPYLVRVSWTHADPVLLVMTRDQKRAQVLTVDPAAASTSVLRELLDEVWVDAVGGVPVRAPGGQVVWTEDVEDVRRVVVNGAPLGDGRWWVRTVVDVDDDGVLVTASVEPTEVQLVRFGWDGRTTQLTSGVAVHSGTSSGGTTVVTRADLTTDGVRVTVHRGGDDAMTPVGAPRNHQESAGFSPIVSIRRLGPRELRTAVVMPRDHQPGGRRLPILMYPYGGPHLQMVMATTRHYLMSQWLADQGFCVVTADGRGTPGRGAAWDRAVRDDLAAVTLEDQVDALAAVVAEYPDDVDPSRVGITGWSYGGYLSALAVLTRPDVFHAAVAGAPVTDMRLYDTFYTERYLGLPDDQPDVYARNNLLAMAHRLERPLLIVHGMVDDNVTVAHTLRLSTALLEAGKAHAVLPLTGVTHLPQQEDVAENLLLLRVAFLQEHLARTQ